MHHPSQQFGNGNGCSVNYTNFETSLTAKDDIDGNCVKNDQESSNDSGNSNDCASSSDSDSSKNSSQKDHVCSKSQNNCAFYNNCPHFPGHSLSSSNEHTLSSGKCPQTQAQFCYFHMPLIFPYAVNCCNYLCSSHKSEKENINSHPLEGKVNVTDEGTENVTSAIKETCVPQNYHLIKNSWHYPLYCSGMPYAYVPVVPFFVPRHFTHKQNCVPSPEFVNESQNSSSNVDNKNSNSNNVDHVSQNPEQSTSDTSVISSLMSEIPDDSLRHPSCSNYNYTLEEHKFQNYYEKNNEQLDVKEKSCNQMCFSENEQKNYNREEVKYKYKSKIPIMIKSVSPNLKNKKTLQNIVNNDVFNDMGTIYINNLLREAENDNNIPQELNDEYKHDVPIIEPNKETGNNNEMKWTVYQSEMHHESISLNMLNIENKIRDTSINILEKPHTIKDKYIRDECSDNKCQTLNYKIKHNSRSGINNKFCVDKSKAGLHEEEERINKERSFSHDESPPPEINLDRMTLQLLLNNQDDGKELGKKHGLEKNGNMYQDNINATSVNKCNENTEIAHNTSIFSRIDLNNNFTKKLPVPVSEIRRNRTSEDLRNKPMSSYDANLHRKLEVRPLEISQNPESLKGINSLKSIGFYSAREDTSSDPAIANENEHSKQSFPLQIALDDLSSTSAKFIVSFLTGQHVAKVDSKGDKVQSEYMDRYIYNFLNNKARNVEKN